MISLLFTQDIVDVILGWFHSHCYRVCCALSPAVALCKCRSVIVSGSVATFSLCKFGLVGFAKTCFYKAVSPLTMSRSTRLQSRYCFSAATECHFHRDHNMYMTLFVPPFSTTVPLSSTGTNGGMDPAGELCWKSSFQLLSPLHIPSFLPLFFFFCLSSFYLTDVFSLWGF